MNGLRAVILGSVFVTLSVGSALGETVRLQVARGHINDIVDEASGSLTLVMKPESANTLEAFTRRAIGQKIEIVIDGKVISSARLMTPLSVAIVIPRSMSDTERRAMIVRLIRGQSTLEMRTHQRPNTL